MANSTPPTSQETHRQSSSENADGFTSPSAFAQHVTLKADLIADKQVFVIGDIHGCHDEFRELLDKAGIGVGNPNAVVILVGDLINKGPKNREVLDLVRRVGAYSVRGNHDQKCLDQLTLLKEGEAIEKEFNWLRDFRDVEYRQLAELPYTISLPSLRAIVVHACLIPGIPLASQNAADMIVMRNLIKLNSQTTGQRYQASKLRIRGEPWASLWPGPEHVYFGHDAVRGLQHYEYATGLDTGCVYGRHLTGVFITGGKQLVQVEAKRIYSKPDIF